MGRIKIEFPNPYIFKTKIKIRVSDINYGGHAGNDNILSIMHECRLQFLQHLGFKSEIDISENIGIIVSDVAIHYKSESFYGDELEVKLAVDDFNKYGFDMLYQLDNLTTNKEAATGKTGAVCVDYRLKKVVPIPEILIQRLNKGQKT
ncbi:MAG: thioesterase family protein [Bacteroidota bacterium]